jgi:hypothetical protein
MQEFVSAVVLVLLEKMEFECLPIFARHPQKMDVYRNPHDVRHLLRLLALDLFPISDDLRIREQPWAVHHKVIMRRLRDEKGVDGL